ncbi:MAG: ZIP family metal transporter [Armatimonadota bacterium]|nr:ZIP family metal transporter [Armatimonadota bacterium]
MLRAGIAVLAATFGGVLGLARKEVSHRTLCALVSFAAGALLSVTAMHIAPEASELAGPGLTAVSIVIGVAIFYLIGKYVSYICPACAASAVDHDKGYLRLGILLMVALGIHSTMDGIAIAVGAEMQKPALGLLILFAVSYHKAPEGLALTSVARLAGFSRSKSLLIAILIELTTGLGAFIGLLVGGISDRWMGIVLAHAGGSFLYVVGFALFTEWREHEKRSIVTYLIAGFLSIWLLGVALASAGISPH